MKPLRLVLIGLLGLLLLLVIVVGLAFTPGVQTWAARKFAPAGPDLTVTIGRVNAGLHETRLNDVRIVQPGMVLTIPSLEIKVGVLDAAGERVDIKQLVAKGWILDLTAPTSSADGDTPASDDPPANERSAEDVAADAFNGVFERLQLPVDLAVDGVDLAGEVLLPNGNAQVSLSGGGLAAGKDGKFTLTANVKTTSAESLTVNGAMTARMNTPRSFERLEFTANASATGPQVPEGATLDLAATAAREGVAETYALTVRSGQRTLFNAHLALPPGSAPLAGTWTLDVARADAASFALGQPLPDFIAKGEGTLEADRALTAIKAAGTLNATVDKLDALQPEFAAFGKLTFATAFNVATEGDLVRVTTLDLQVSGAKPVVSVTALQAIEFNSTSGELRASDPAAELLRITIDGVPLAWAKPFLGDITMSGEDIRGTFTASAADGGFALRPAKPVTITGLSISQAGAPLVTAVDLLLSAQADYTPKGWTANVTDLSLRSGGATLLTLTAKASQPAGAQQPLTASGTFEGNLPPLLAQPAAGNLTTLKTGIARGDFTLTSADTQLANVTMQLADLVGTDAAPLPSVALQARVEIDASGRIDARVPIVITQRKRRSDITINAAITTVGETTNIDGKLTGDAVHVNDVMALSALTSNPPEAGSPENEPVSEPRPGSMPDSTPTPAPTEPVWAGITGEIKLAFDRLIYAKGIESSLKGAIRITPDALNLERLKGVLKTGGDLNAEGGLKFETGRKLPYHLKADITLNEVEPAPIMRALSPKEPSPVEGKFDFKTTLAGRAIDPSAFNENVIGDIHLSSKGGTFKALDVKTSSMVDGAGAVAGIAGAIGVLAGSDSTVKYADMARAAADVAKQLGSIKFDELNMRVTRDKKKNMQIEDIRLISPFVHLTGSGRIKHVKDKSLVERPLLVNLKLGAKNKLAANLRTLNLVGDKKDALGYAALVEDLKLGGSLESIDTSELQGLLNHALAN